MVGDAASRCRHISEQPAGPTAAISTAARIWHWNSDCSFQACAGRVKFFEVIAGELARLARSAGYMFWWTGGSAEDLDPVATLGNAEKICDQFIQRKVAGVFFASFEHMPQCESTNYQAGQPSAVKPASRWFYWIGT
ncbi:MAG: hypothetical protein WDM76_16355 [Limisphaerales bacterium]